MKILFLVNGPAQSAAANRARQFMRSDASFSEVQIEDDSSRQCAIAYRPARKWFGIAQFLGKCLSFRPGLIYVMDTAYTGVLAALFYKAFTSCPVIVDTGDAAFALACSTGNYSRLQLWLILWTEKAALHLSDGVVVRGTFHRPVLEQEGVARIAVIPDGVDCDEFRHDDPAAILCLREQLGLSGYLVVGMVGAMEWSRRYDMCYGWDLVEALRHLRGQKVKALLVGDGTGRAHLERRAEELGVRDRVVFAGRIEFPEIETFLRAMDVCVSTQSNDRVGWVRTTGKLPLYLACGRYVVATDTGEAHRILPEIGHLLPYTGVRDDAHPSRLAEHLASLCATPGFASKASGAREVAVREFNYPVLRKKMSDFCVSVVRARQDRSR